MSVLRFGREKERLSLWMQLAFMAGHDLGRAHPEFVEEVLPGQELREGARRVGVIQQCSGQNHLTCAGPQRACEQIAETQWRDVPEGKYADVLLEAVVKSLRSGFAAGTVVQVDPLHCEFVWDIPERIADGMTTLASRLIVGALVNAVEKLVAVRLEHPLLRLAREYYPGKRKEPELVLGFLRAQLQSLQAKSEDQCPASELDLADWVSSAVDYGRRLYTKNPNQVSAVFEECRAFGLEGTLQLVRNRVARAGGTNPLRLVQQLKEWHQRAFDWLEPQFYGQELERVVHFADFALWIPWACEFRLRN
jgi:hypothetical protein